MLKTCSWRRLSFRVLGFSLILLSLVPVIAQQPRSSDPMKLLQYRLIGPFRGGRVTAVSGVTSQPRVYYFGATGGGVWKTTDAGTNWQPVSDNYFKTGSVGAI